MDRGYENETSMVKESPKIERAMMRQMEAITELDIVTTKLQEKLAPIVTPTPADRSDSETEAGMHASALTIGIHEHTDRIERVSLRLRELLANLDV